jgi:hypothetical protein
LIREWDCASEIEKEFGYKPGNIASCCRGLSITANGFIWRYKDDFIEIDLEKLNYQKRKVKQYDMKGNFIKSYDSIKEAAGIGFNEGNIQDCCVGRSKSHRGYMWRYAEDSAPEKYKSGDHGQGHGYHRRLACHLLELLDHASPPSALAIAALICRHKSPLESSQTVRTPSSI